MTNDAMRFETAAIHVGQDPDPTTGAAIVPIYQTSTYVQERVAEHKGFEYSRTDNPTRRALETCLSALEGSKHSLTFASGMAAITTLAMTLKQGDRALLADDVYGGTYRLFSKVLMDLGISFNRVDMTDLAAVEKELAGGAAMVLAETPTNPLLKILDLEALAELAHGAGAHLTVDNTFATSYIQKPLDFGADSVIYSGTKYLGGHSDLVMGSLSTDDDELVERLQFLRNAIGNVPGPFDCWLMLRGLKTLAIRMRAHSDNASRIVAWLKEQPGVERVYYPGDPDFDGYEVATRQMTAAGKPLYGGMVSIEMANEPRALEVCSKTKLFWLAESLGGVESLIEHPGQMTHASLAGSGGEIHDALIRLSVGIEHVDDLIADLEQALA